MLGIGDRGANIGGAVGQQLDLHRLRQRGGERGQQRADIIGGGDNVGARLALHVEHDGGFAVRPGAKPAVFRALFDRGDIAEPHRRAVFIADDQLTVILRRLHLVVSGESNGTLRAVEAAFRRVDVGAADGGAHLFAGQAERRQRLSVHLHAHRRSLTAGERHQPDAGNLGDFLRDARLHHILYLGQRHAAGGHRQRHDRRIGGIDLAVDRRVRQIVGQQAGGGVNGGLYFLLGDVERQRQLELQGDHRRAAGALRRHLFQP